VAAKLRLALLLVALLLSKVVDLDLALVASCCSLEVTVWMAPLEMSL
jgi:hypothetical protein